MGQFGAPAHPESADIKTNEWPPNLPDLSPLDYMFGGKCWKLT